MSAPVVETGRWSVLFDLGGVVLTWDPARAYEQVLPADAVPDFMATIGFDDWNRAHDSGRRYVESEAELVARHPEHADTVLAYRRHFSHTLGTVPGTGAVMAELQQAGVGLNALTNWSAETFPVARERFGLLGRFGGILVSGAELMAKPDPAIFTLALQRFGLDAERTVFVDDSLPNVEAAHALGLTGLAFRGADQLRADLVDLGLLAPRRPVGRPVLHLTERSWWQQALADGVYPWSSRRATYEAEGFVHTSFADQTPGTRQRYYGDLPDDELVVLELDPDQLSVPVVVEDLGAGPYPHLYGPLPVAEVVSARPYAP